MRLEGWRREFGTWYNKQNGKKGATLEKNEKEKRMDEEKEEELEEDDVKKSRCLK